VSNHPHEELKVVYKRILQTLANMPSTAAYRIHTEKLILNRYNLVTSEPDILKLEDKIGMGQIEEVLEQVDVAKFVFVLTYICNFSCPFFQAKMELELARTMEKYRPWEPLIEKEPLDQWRWPV